MKKVFIAISMIAVCGITSVAETSAFAKGKSKKKEEPAFGCVATCEKVLCGPEYKDVEKALEEIDKAEKRCDEKNREKEQAPPEKS